MSKYVVYVVSQGLYKFGKNGRIANENGRWTAYIVDPATRSVDTTKPGLKVKNIHADNLGETLFQFFWRGGLSV